MTTNISRGDTRPLTRGIFFSKSDGQIVVATRLDMMSLLGGVTTNMRTTDDQNANKARHGGACSSPCALRPRNPDLAHPPRPSLNCVR